jgi:hypothetical protein
MFRQALLCFSERADRSSFGHGPEAHPYPPFVLRLSLGGELERGLWIDEHQRLLSA